MGLHLIAVPRNALMSINGVTRGLSALRKLIQNRGPGECLEVCSKTCGSPTCRARTRLLSVNPLLLTQLPQTDESNPLLHLRLNGLSGVPNLPTNPWPVTHAELAKAVELQRDFLRLQDPKVLPMIEALSVTGTQADAADLLGITESEFGRTRDRISQLAECFLSGEPVPKQRRPYKKRVAKTIQFSTPDCPFPILNSDRKSDLTTVV